MIGTRLRAAVGLAVAQLRHKRTHTALVVVGITLAVLSTTLLASVGYGVVATGEEKFGSANQDLWITAGSVQFAPGSVGGVENKLVDSHRVARDISSREDVKIAAPMGFQTIYLGTSPDPNAFETVVGVGVPGVSANAISLSAGRGFVNGDPHYAGGTYDGPMTHEIVVDQQLAQRYNLSVGDTVYAGGTIANARQNRFTIVGISSTFSQFLGAPTATLPLSELQTLTGSEGSDPAALITVTLKPGADPETVAEELRAEYPNYQVRTNQEQLQSVLQGQALVIASGVTLVVLALVAGIALTVNVLAMLVFQQRVELAALKAVGLSSRTLGAIAASQGLLLGLVGGVAGLALTPVAVRALNFVTARLVGLEGLVQMPPWVIPVGLFISLVIGTIGAIVAGVRVARIAPLTQLQNR
ncbi:ABC transporter permease [Haladaptatus sp. YSMS36]|uniref:ABC transporter permease n=1 Tax=Haladaptatus sp. YSMS36 TaxID=3033384 RepID=UPI0023E788E8|nr:ABC transporter permease [Haladaptatus sp. YSMS36]